MIIIITTGLTLAFGDTSGGFRRLIQIVFGLSIAFAASSFFLSLLLVRRRGHSSDERALSDQGPPTLAGFSVPVHRALTEPILLGGAPRAASPSSTARWQAALGLGLRLWLVGLALWGRRSLRSGVGRADATRCSSRSPGAICSSPAHLTLGVSANHDEPCRISPLASARLADYLPWAALVGRGCRPQQGRQLPEHRPGSAVPTSIQLRARRADRRRRPPQQCVSAPGLRMGDLRRGRQRHPRGAKLSLEPVHGRRGSALVDAERKADFEEAGAAFRNELLSSPSPSCRRRMTPRAPRAGSMKDASRPGVDPHDAPDRSFVDRTDRVLQLLEGASCRSAAGSTTARP